jgi:aminopeptidase N
VRVDGVSAEFVQTGGELSVRLAAPAEPGRAVGVVIEYDLDYGGSRGEGLTWSKAEPEAAGLTRQWPQVHSQGEPESSSQWFACHDFPNERLTTELIVTVPEGFEVLSNGRLEGLDGAGPGRQRWHWVQARGHVNYLVALAIAKFAVIDLGGPESGRPGLSLPVYTPVGTEENVRAVFANTGRMVALFERLFDEPYPWDKYAQAMVRDFAAGGMENTSCTFLAVGTSRSRERGSQDDLISHELAHQWFGDLVTCRSWEHLWLNEGWATYSEALWAEHFSPEGEPRTPEAGRAAYFRSILGAARGQRRRNQGSAPEREALVSNRYRNPDAVFTKADDPYGKGAMVLHMLRERLGDEAFFAGTRLYLDRFKDRCAETEQFRRCMEEASGQSLERFFWQWCERPGIARLAVDLEWDEEGGSLSVAVEQTQRIDRLNPAYAFGLPLYVKFDDGTDEWLDIVVDGRQASGVFTLKGKPSQVSVDPNLTVLAATQVRKPLAMWLEEAERGVTLPAVLAAVEALRGVEDPRARAALGRIAARGDTPMMVREAASVVSARDE